MSKVTQREAVYNAITSTFSENGVAFEDGQDISSMFTTEMRSSVHQALTEGFASGRVQFEDTPSNREKLASPAKLSNYVSGLISNWVRKDKRFNGGVAYAVKNPGSRTGQGDDQLKNLRMLKKQFEAADSSKVPAIEAAIAKRLAEIHAERSKTTPLSAEQISSLDPELIATLGLTQEA